MRKNYIDNLRWAAVLLLIPYHTMMMYNNWGESFYIWVDGLEVPSLAIGFLWPAFMPLLFVLAGISTKFALEKRSPKEYLKERVLRLFVPLVFGILLLIPVQTYFAERYHNGYTGGYFAQYILFFTKETDLTGYHGGFSPGHLWFILYLFVISLAAVGIILLVKKTRLKIEASKVPFAVIVSMFVVTSLMTPLLDIAGKSVTEYFTLFLLGYYLLSEDAVMEKLERNRWWLVGLFVVSEACYVFLGITGLPVPWPLFDVLIRAIGWLTILVLLVFAKRRFNMSNKVTRYLSAASFPLYLFHQSALVAVAFYVVGFTDIPIVQGILIVVLTAALSFAVYELFKRFAPTRFMFGIKYNKNKSK